MLHRKEIVFCIQGYNSSPMPAVVLSIEEVESSQDGKRHFNVRKRQLYADSLKELALKTELELIERLIKEELRFSRAAGLRESVDTKPFNLVRLQTAGLQPLLRALAASKKLYYKGRLLLCDFFSPHEYFLRLNPPVEGKISVEGMLKIKDKEVRLKECDLVVPGPPHWFILGDILGIIAGNVEWKWFSQILEAEEYCLSQRKVEDLFGEEEEEDARLPKVKWVEERNSTFTEQDNVQIFPILKLTDRLGAFADLWMDYGSDRRVGFHEHLKMAASADKKQQVMRDLAAEKQWEKDLLETDFTIKQVGSSHYYCPVDKVGKSLTFLLECGWHIIDWKGKRLIKQGAAELSIGMQQQAILVSGKIHYDTFEANLSQVIGAFNRREHFIDLSPTTSGLLSYDFMEKDFGDILLEGELTSDSVKIKRAHLGTLADLWENSSDAARPVHSRKIMLDKAIEELRTKLALFRTSQEYEIADYLPSSSFQGVLRPYQQMGVSWMSFLKEFGFHGILADDMGLGKTVQVLALLSRHQFTGPGMIVAPTSLLFNWRTEIGRFLPTIPITLHRGPLRFIKPEEFQPGSIILTSYSLLRIDQELLSKVHFDFAILDEAQAIKNAEAKVAKAAFQLNADFRLCLSGTPVENRLQELWSLFRFLIPDFLGSKEQFQKEMEASAADGRYLQRLKKKVHPFIMRRTKKEVAKDLPEKIEQVVWVEMPSSQRQIYEKFLQGVRADLLKKVSLDGLSSHRIEVFESILRLRQICCHPLLLGSMISTPEGIEPFESGKWDVLMDDLDTIVQEKRKVLVYSQFTSMLQLMAKEVNQKGWKAAYLDGSSINREEIVKTFQEDPEVNLFLISLKAGGVGLNLTSADYVIIYDPWWNDAVENQAIDRAHRIGRTEPVIAKRLITLESIEEKMMKLKKAKREMTEHLWDGELQLSALTEEDFQYLLS